MPKTDHAATNHLCDAMPEKWVRISIDSCFDGIWMFVLGRYEEPPTPTLVARVFVGPNFEILQHEIFMGRSTKTLWTLNDEKDRKRRKEAIDMTTPDLLETSLRIAQSYPLAEPYAVHDVNDGLPVKMGQPIVH